MVSRDSKVQVAVVVATMALATLWVRYGTTGALESGLFVVAAYVLLFAGSHAYLALRGDGDSVPVDARWRFVGLVSFVVTALLVGNSYAGVELAGQSVSAILVPLLGVLVLAYWLYEARDAYRTSRQT